MITLQWKQFTVKLDRMHKLMQQNIPNYDGMIADIENLRLTFTASITQQEEDYVYDYWDSLTEQTETTPTSEEQLENIKNLVKQAMTFGQGLIITFAAENVAMGITQANKTRQVATYLSNLQVFLNSGSLYGALQEIDDIITAGIPENLSPYVTEERLLEYKEIIEDYLGI